jgi:hypothetical protein
MKQFIIMSILVVFVTATEFNFIQTKPWPVPDKAAKASNPLKADAATIAAGTLEITKAKIQIDTLADRTINATLLEFKDSIWIPVIAADVRIAVKRLGADLNVAEAPTYATDSLGVATAEFKQDSLPGDSKGNLVLIAHVDNHDLYGNLSSEKMVPWGK